MLRLSVNILGNFVSFNSTQDCFKASWGSHKSAHLKAKLSALDQNSDKTWLYCIKRGQARTPKLPYFDWAGYI